VLSGFGIHQAVPFAFQYFLRRDESEAVESVTITIFQHRILALIVSIAALMLLHGGQEALAQLPRSHAVSRHRQPPPPIDMTRVLNSRFRKSDSKVVKPKESPLKNDSSNPWQPEADERTWKYIVLHHTATSKGSVASIHQAHLQRVDSQGNPWRGIGYHFVIGNGNGMKDGKIEQTFRWLDQIEGAHAGNANYNNAGIGICLIGNFDKTKPTPKQLASLKTLLEALKKEHEIDSSNVMAHKSVKSTHCPGKYFPLHLFSQAKGYRGVHHRYRYRLR